MTIAGICGLGISGMGVSMERPANARRTASAGWYRTAATAELASARNAGFEFFNGDCFDPATKNAVLDHFGATYGPIDYLIYSVASPRRTDADGTTYQSVIKPLEEPHTTYSIDVGEATSDLIQVNVSPASDAETRATVKVMGGEDWTDWIAAAASRDLLAPAFKTVALSYIGSALTAPIYRHGTIGAAKSHLEETAKALTKSTLGAYRGVAFTSVNGAAVTQASTAIPGISLYVSLLHSVLGSALQTPIQQATRLWSHLTGEESAPLDEQGRVRLDDWEFAEGVQDAVERAWKDAVTAGKAPDDAASWFLTEVRRLYGFDVDGIDYSSAVETEQEWPASTQ